jgi:xanthine/CO dehydrogenase XdhC/CoxF family maturation factor
MQDVFAQIERWQNAGERVALATLIAVHGSAPRSEGAKMAITQSGKVVGSVSGGCVEAAVAEEAQRVMQSGQPAIVRYGINRNMMWDIGLSCGGTIEVFIEPL